MSILRDFRYRPDIDGLRAVAVLAVVLYHAGLGAPGGFVGVDVFFVISGFLICSLIWKDLEAGRFSLVDFWERRARRIAPALTAATLATFVAGWFLLLPSDFKELGQATAAQAVFGANFHYEGDADYFSGSAEEKPLLHTWSLAVEEQFYLLAPLLLAGMYRRPRLRSRAALWAVLGTVALASCTWNVFDVSRHPSETFYFLHTRAWEMLLGALAAFLPAWRWMEVRAVREGFSLVGLGLIVACVALYSAETEFPGPAAIPPCLGAALLIAANRPNERGATAVGALLSLRPLVFVGLISYSLYLWHWPLLAFSNYRALEPLGITQRLALAATGFLLAVLSWKYIETPFRRRHLGATRRAMFSYAGAGLAAVLSCGLIGIVGQGFPSRFSPRLLAFADAKLDRAFINKVEIEDAKAGRFVPLGEADAANSPSLFVWGDSHAMAALPAVDALLRERGQRGEAATHSATPPVLDWFAAAEWGLREASIEYNQLVFEYIERRQFHEVLLVAAWDGYCESPGFDAEEFRAALLETVRRLVSVGANPRVMLSAPRHDFDVPRALAQPFYSAEYVETHCATPRDVRPSATDGETVRRIVMLGGRVIDPRPMFLDRESGRYVIQSQGRALYRDSHHLTTYGAKLKLLPLFRQELGAASVIQLGEAMPSGKTDALIAR